MRMMTGAILILAHVMLFGVYDLGEPKRIWLEWYSFALGGIGAAFLAWGFYLDITTEHHRRPRRMKKGDT